MTDQSSADVVTDLRSSVLTAVITTGVANPNRTRLVDLLGWDDLAEGR